MSNAKSPRSKTVVIVDADPDARQMYAEVFRHYGLRVVPVVTGRDALAVAPRADAIVTETLLLGDMDGIELIARLKGDGRTAGIPLVVVSSHAWNTDRERARLAGCDLFLSKPCLPHDLMRAVRRLIVTSRPPVGRRLRLKASLPTALAADRRTVAAYSRQK